MNDVTIIPGSALTPLFQQWSQFLINAIHGTVWRNGSGAPSDSLGLDGDYYLDTDSGNIYSRLDGVYSLTTSIKGAVTNLYNTASLPAAGSAGRLALLTDGTHNLSLDTGTQWVDIEGGVFNVRNFGAKGDGVTDDTAAIQSAINAAANAVLFFPVGTYLISSALSIANSMVVRGHGATINTNNNNAAGIKITSSNVRVEGLTFTSPQYTVQKANSAGIYALGPSAASPITQIVINRCTFTSWGIYGIQAQYVQRFDFSENNINNIQHAGIVMLSCSRGVVARNRVDTVVDTPNAYGITATKVTSNSLVTDPVSSDIIIHGNVVNNVTNWEGLDTHGGLRITFDSNIVTNCPYGISAGEAKDLSGTPIAGATDIRITNNALDSGVRDGSAQNGINLVGGGTAVGLTTFFGTGVISGNTIRGYGNDATNTNGGGGGAIYLHDTMGVTVSHNTIFNPSPRGIYLYHDNYGFMVVGNTVVDSWTNYSGQGTAPAIQVVNDYNIGTIAQNSSYVTGTQSGLHVLDTHLYVADLPNNNIRNIPGYSTAATLLSDSGNHVGPVAISSLQIGTTALPANTALFARRDVAAVLQMSLQNLSTSPAAAAQFQMSANGASGGLAAWGSTFATARQADRIGVYCNSNPSGILLDAPNAGQDIRMFAGSGNESCRVDSTGHLQLITGTPIITAGSGAGTGGSVSITGSDQAGYISLTPGTAPTSGVVATITFGNAFSSIPRGVIISAANQNAAALSGNAQIHESQQSRSTTGCVIKVGSIPLTSGTPYTWSYQVIG